MTPLTHAHALAALWLITTVPASAAGQHDVAPGGAGVRIPYEKYVLSNGLTVVLSPDHSTPTVAVDVLYHVGSKDEVPGHTGFAHLFEHLMFTGSGHVAYGLHDKYTQGVGGNNNGRTSADFTEFSESVPSNYLEIELWLESDRMGFLLDSLDEGKFEAQREIVQNERRQQWENQPYKRDNEVLNFYMYPPNHPYSRQPIGGMTDVRAASVEDVKGFFRRYYTPNNATLVIAGDFDAAVARKWIGKYFGDLPRGGPARRPLVEPARLTAEQYLTFEDHVQVPRMTIQWPSLDIHSPDQAALDVLSDVLGNSRTARINKALVYDRQSAVSVGVFQNPYEATGQFQVILTPRPGHTLTELEAQVDSILEEIKRDGPTEDEVERVKAGHEINFLTGLQSNLGKAQQLGADEIMWHNPGYTAELGLRKSQAVTTSDVRRVAREYLGKGRVVLSTVPIGKPELASHADASKVVSDPFADRAPAVRR